MTRGGLDRLLAAHGADPRRWPAPACGPALRLLRRSAQARAAYLKAQEADTALALEAEAVDPARIARLAQQVRRRVPPPPVFPPRAAWPALQAGALAACALLGLWVGWSAPPQPTPPTVLASIQLTPVTDPLP